MTNAEKIFLQIIDELPDGIEGRMFGAKSIKSKNGKTVAFLWEKDMTFKLNKTVQSEALKLNGAKIGTHLYAKDKQMKGWILIPNEHSEKWSDFAKKAIDYVCQIKNNKREQNI